MHQLQQQQGQHIKKELQRDKDITLIDILDTIPNEVPTCQSMGRLVGLIRNSKFVQPKSIAELNDLEVMVAYVSFLLMILVRPPIPNSPQSMSSLQLTATSYRKRFINGYYASWDNRNNMWDKDQEGGKKFRPQEAHNE